MAGLQFDEETITNTNLLELWKRNRQDVVIYQFTKKKEATTGADWEWWLTDGNHWLGLLIQAKKLNLKSLKYEYLDHKVGSSGALQIDILLAHAKRKAIFPIYCFYNYFDPDQYSPTWNCPVFGVDLELLGCSIADAYSVKQCVDNGQKHLTDIGALAYPWSCLACCTVSDTQQPPRRTPLPLAAANFLEYATSDRADSFPPDTGWQAALDVRGEPPAYVRALLESGEEEGGRVFEEFRKDLEPLSGLVVIKDREGQG